MVDVVMFSLGGEEEPTTYNNGLLRENGGRRGRERRGSTSHGARKGRRVQALMRRVSPIFTERVYPFSLPCYFSLSPKAIALRAPLCSMQYTQSITKQAAMNMSICTTALKQKSDKVWVQEEK